ncbi:MAG: magnesium transporter [Nitrospirota bacterium]
MLFELPLSVSVKHRIPWLIVGLLGGILAAKAIGFFEGTLTKNLVLAAFIPLVVYMSDAVGTQMEAFIIRDLAVNPRLNFLRYLTKQLQIVILIASIISVILFLASILLYRDFDIGKVLGITLFSAIISSVFTGLIIPYLLSRLKFDPADASGPIATIIQDILSVIIYFGIASLIL